VYQWKGLNEKVKVYQMLRDVFQLKSSKKAWKQNENIMLPFFLRNVIGNCINFKIHFIFVAQSKQNSNFQEDFQRSESRQHFVNFKRQHFGQHINDGLPFY
jgi:hypothetical protein